MINNKKRRKTLKKACNPQTKTKKAQNPIPKTRNPYTPYTLLTLRTCNWTDKEIRKTIYKFSFNETLNNAGGYQNTHKTGQRSRPCHPSFTFFLFFLRHLHREANWELISAKKINGRKWTS